MKPHRTEEGGEPEDLREAHILLFMVSGIWKLLLSQCLLNGPKKFWLCRLPAVSTTANVFTSLSFDFHLCQNGDNNYNSSFTGLLLRLDEIIALESILFTVVTQCNGKSVEIKM